MPSLSIPVAVDFDDVHHRGDHDFQQSALLIIGNIVTWGGSDALFRYSVNIPRGSVITSAVLRFKPVNNYTDDTVNLRFYAEDADDAAQLADDTDYHTRAVIGTTVDWNSVPHWSTNVLTDSVDISTLIQALVNRPGWFSGNFINIFLRDNGSSSNALRACHDWTDSDPDGTETVTLEVEWADTPSVLNLQPAVGLDDGRHRILDTVHTVNTTLGAAIVGRINSTFNYDAWQRYLINIPPESTIVNAYLSFRTFGGESSIPVIAKIAAHLHPNPPQVPDGDDTTWHDVIDNDLTVAQVAWTITDTWVQNVWYDSVDIASIIQELVNQPGWASGNAVSIFVLDDGSSNGRFRQFSQVESSGGGKAPRLHISWIPPIELDALGQTVTSGAGILTVAGVQHASFESGPIESRPLFSTGLITAKPVYKTGPIEARSVFITGPIRTGD